MRLQWVTALMVVFTLSGLATASPEGDDGTVAYTEAALQPIFQIEDDLNSQIDAFLGSESGAAFQTNATWIGRATATVPVLSSHSDWAKHRSLAFGTAWSKVQEEFIRFQFPSSRSEVIRKLYADASGNMPEYQVAEYTGNEAIDEFIDKSGAYVSSRLNSALDEINIDPEAFNRGDRKQRTKLLEEAIQVETVTRAVGKLRGLWLLKSFGGTIGGHHAIGVIGIYRPSYEELASEITDGRQIQPSSNRGSPLAEKISKDPSQLMTSFGTRVLRDENGYPVLISFGQWGVNSNDTNPTISARFRDAAISQARALADTEMQQFLNGSANYSDRSFVASTVVQYVDVDRSGFSELVDSIDISDVVDQVLTARAQVKLPGLRDYYVWTHKHPETGHNLVGVVRVWSPNAAAAASAIRTGPAASSPQRPESSVNSVAESPQEGANWTEESPDYVDPDDF